MNGLARTLLALSLLSNAVLAGWWFFGQRNRAPAYPSVSEPSAAAKAATSGNAAGGAAEDSNGFWSAVNSGNDAEYARRLQKLGLSPLSVYLMIHHRVRDRYADRLKALHHEPRRYWLVNPYEDDLRAEAWDEYRRLTRTMFQEMDAALGPTGFYQSATQAGLRRKFGDLPDDKLRRVREIERDYAEVEAKMARDRRGVLLPSDAEAMALAAAEGRNDLAQVLTPEEMHEADVRSSRSAQLVQASLRHFDATEEEYRKLAELRLAFDQRFGGDFPTGAQQEDRTAAEPALLAEFDKALGPERFAEYRAKSDPAYAGTLAFVKRYQLVEETAAEIVNIRRSLLQRAEQLRGNPSIPAAQRALELSALSAEASASLARHLSPDALQSYTAGDGKWISQLARPEP